MVAGLAVNLLALLIVLGLCWGAMMWLSDGFHSHRATTIDLDGVGDPNMFAAPTEPIIDVASCDTCEGVGAHNTDGRVAPCTECFGTGILS